MLKSHDKFMAQIGHRIILPNRAANSNFSSGESGELSTTVPISTSVSELLAAHFGVQVIGIGPSLKFWIRLAASPLSETWSTARRSGRLPPSGTVTFALIAPIRTGAALLSWRPPRIVGIWVCPRGRLDRS